MKDSIRFRLTLWLILVTGPTVIAGGIAVHLVGERLEHRIEAELANTLRLEAARLHGALAANQRELELLAANPLLRQFVRQMSAHRAGRLDDSIVIAGYGGFDEVDRYSDHPLEQLANGMVQLAASGGIGVAAVRLLDRSGEELGQTDGFTWIPYDQSLIQRTLETGTSHFGNAFPVAFEQPRLGVVVPIFASGTTLVGAMQVELELAPIVDLMAEHEYMGESTESHIAQRNANGDAEYITPLRSRLSAPFKLIVPNARQLPVNQSLQSPDVSTLRSPDYRSVDSILAIKTLPLTGWGLVVKIDAAEAFAPVQQVRNTILLAVFITLLVLLVGWIVYLHPLTKRLTATSEAAKRVASGEYESPIEDATPDEIGRMARSIDRLAADLRHDVALREQAEARLRHQAMHDELTGLVNRQYANGVLAELENSHSDTAILFLDLDGFKPINDQHGHAIGDEVLVQTARRLADTVDDAGTLARWGGDEFVVILPDYDALRANTLAGRLQRQFDTPLVTSAGTHRVSCSIGISTTALHSDMASTVVAADTRMYEFKERRKSERRLQQSAEHHAKRLQPWRKTG